MIDPSIKSPTASNVVKLQQSKAAPSSPGKGRTARRVPHLDRQIRGILPDDVALKDDDTMALEESINEMLHQVLLQVQEVDHVYMRDVAQELVRMAVDLIKFQDRTCDAEQVLRLIMDTVIGHSAAR